METIEERAKERYENPEEPYCFETDREQQWYRCGECDGYIAGAYEQDRIARQEERERCIKIACEHLCKLCLAYTGTECNAKYCKDKENIRKAMEGGEDGND